MNDYRPSILIVEDEDIVAMDLEQSLAVLGYKIAGVAESASKAVRLAETSQPDLVLMDVQLKGPLDGVAAAHEIRTRLCIPVVFVTANTNEETVARANTTAPYGYLIKPFRTKELNATILVALHQHRLAQELFAEKAWITTMLASISDGVIATDVQGHVRYINPAGEMLTGWSAAEALGAPIEQIYPLTTISGEEVQRCQLRRALASASPVPKERFVLQTKSGVMLPIEDAAAPIAERGQLIGAVTVFRDITDRLREEQKQEDERDRLEERVQATVEALGQTRYELRALSGHLIQAQEEERRRLARDLHDDFGQRTAMLEVQADHLAALLPHGEAQQALQVMRAQIAGLSKGLRETSHLLHPAVLVDLGLLAGLRNLVDEFRQNGMDIVLHVKDISTYVPVEIATVLYRITQEALRNAAKYARRAPASVTLTEKDQQWHLTIEDCGPGFELGHARLKHGLGLLSMQERARTVGGSMLLRTAPGKGTRLLVRVPIGGGGN